MSRQLVNTILPGWGPPRQDTPVQSLNELFLEKHFNGAFLESASQAIEGYCGKDRPMTEDRYSWFWSFEFSVPSGKICLLIPWGQDSDKKDGSHADRSIAIYTQGEVTDEQISSLVTNFQEACSRKFQEEQAAAARKKFENAW